MLVNHLKLERGMKDKEITEEFVKNVFKTITKSEDMSLSRQDVHQFLFDEKNRLTPAPPQQNIFETPTKENNQTRAVRFEVEEPDQKQKAPSTETLFSDVMTRIKELEGTMGPMKM